MQSGFTPHSEQINEMASDWFTLMQSESVTQQQREQFQQWLEHSGAHRDAYQQLELIWNDLEQLSHSPEGASLQRSVQSKTTVGVFSGLYESLLHFFHGSGIGLRSQMALAVTCMAIVASVIFVSQPSSPEATLYATKVGEVKTLNLADGSQITLGAKSTIKAWSDKHERHVILESGQAFFDVAKDPQRPFWVNAFDTRIKVVGTQFDVRSNKGKIRVAVVEGVVNVSLSDKANQQPADPYKKDKDKKIVLTAGQQVIKPRSAEFSSVTSISESEINGWRQGRLSYRNANLSDVVGDANRYFDGMISLDSSELAQMKVTIALRTDQVAFLPDLLSQTLPIVVDKKTDKNIVISLKK